MNIVGFVMVGTNDLEKSREFYDAILVHLGLKKVTTTERYIGYGHSDDDLAVKFYITKPHDKNNASVGNGTMVALSAESKEAVNKFHKTALENGTALTIDSITTSAITSVANASGFSNLASNFASIVQTTNQKIAEGYSGMALALSDPSNEDSITLLSNARATAAASQDTLLSTIETSLSSGTGKGFENTLNE